MVEAKVVPVAALALAMMAAAATMVSVVADMGSREVCAFSRAGWAGAGHVDELLRRRHRAVEVRWVVG